MLPSQTQLPSASNIRIPQYTHHILHITHHTPHITLLTSPIILHTTNDCIGWSICRRKKGCVSNNQIKDDSNYDSFFNNSSKWNMNGKVHLFFSRKMKSFDSSTSSFVWYYSIKIEWSSRFPFQLERHAGPMQYVSYLSLIHLSFELPNNSHFLPMPGTKFIISSQ